jgi:hypothetical protein
MATSIDVWSRTTLVPIRTAQVSGRGIEGTGIDDLQPLSLDVMPSGLLTSSLFIYITRLRQFYTFNLTTP